MNVIRDRQEHPVAGAAGWLTCSLVAWVLEEDLQRGQVLLGVPSEDARREGLDPAEATDVLLTLAGPGVFLNFTEGRGWSLQRYVNWTTDALCGLLLRGSHTPAVERE